MHGRRGNGFRVKTGKPEGKKVTKCSWDGTIEMDFKERGWKGMNWNHLTLNGVSRGLL